jgi:hypothetical protein
VTKALENFAHLSTADATIAIGVEFFKDALELLLAGYGHGGGGVRGGRAGRTGGCLILALAAAAFGTNASAKERTDLSHHKLAFRFDLMIDEIGAIGGTEKAFGWNKGGEMAEVESIYRRCELHSSKFGKKKSWLIGLDHVLPLRFG